MTQHTPQEWIGRAEAIDAGHGDGIADETRALAERLQRDGADRSPASHAIDAVE